MSDQITPSELVKPIRKILERLETTSLRDDAVAAGILIDKYVMLLLNEAKADSV